MIEPVLSLALSMQANPGVYAILMGSGVNAVDLSGHYFGGSFWRRIRRELVAVLFES